MEMMSTTEIASRNCERRNEIKVEQRKRENRLLDHLRSTENSKKSQEKFENISLDRANADASGLKKGNKSPQKTQANSQGDISNLDFDDPSFDDDSRRGKKRGRRHRLLSCNKFKSKKSKFKNFKMKRYRRKSKKKRQKKGKNSKQNFSSSSTIIKKRLRFPTVTTKKWVLYDLDDDKPIAGLNINKRGEIASLTKMMTCLIACKFIQKNSLDPHDTMYSVSYRAAKTGGTTARLREGDYMPLADLLYALMLPSGNDAGITIAENVALHSDLLSNPINKKCNGALYEKEMKRRMNRLLPKFYKKMNKLAKALHMKNTNYASAHGLSNRMNYSSPLDQAHLAAAALKNEIFKDVVNTVNYTADVERDGAFETLEYVNSNLLLQKKDYFGVKTGITNPAGGCLVSGYERDKRRYLCVVVGSSGKKTRFSDTEKIFEWLFLNKDDISSAEPVDRFRFGRR